ncbi:jmjC domain-containing protein 7 isoform X2 [Ananas comosus]|uniref:JmjC domain-containing protein 7 isoform X2 n=1 Tax=Ananas comosus TaxID=4615 RepID=A0A6P5FJL3_ANACO|nr:jmjC domain-containing protein 7 isoform X2 [Ananas comosus]
MEKAVRNLWVEARELMRQGDLGGVERLDSPPSPLRFLREYVSANRPFIVSGAATRHWPAISHSLWSNDDYLCNALRNCTVSVHLTPNGRADALAPLPLPSGGEGESITKDGTQKRGGLCFASACVRSMEFPEALQLIKATGRALGPSTASVVAYAQQQDNCLPGEYAAVAGDVEAHIPWASEALGCLPEAVNLWIGNDRSQTSFHKDHYENLYVVITGEKHFLLLPPTEVHRLYICPYLAARYTLSSALLDTGTGGLRFDLEVEEPERQVPWCSVDPYPPSPEDLAVQMSSFPLYFDGPRPFECTVKAGEILYLPSMWFHHVRQTPDSNGQTIAVNYCMLGPHQYSPSPQLF